MQFVHEKLRSTQAALSGKSGALLREMTANDSLYPLHERPAKGRFFVVIRFLFLRVYG